jgi:hypothetical protein
MKMMLGFLAVAAARASAAVAGRNAANRSGRRNLMEGN